MKRLAKHSRKRSGFTLPEFTVASSIGVLVLAGVMPVFLMSHSTWSESSLRMSTHLKATVAIERMVFGQSDGTGLRGCTSASLATNANGWAIDYTNLEGNMMQYAYSAAASNITFTVDGSNDEVIVENVIASSMDLVNHAMTLSVSVRGTRSGRTNTATSTTTAAFRNQW